MPDGLLKGAILAEQNAKELANARAVMQQYHIPRGSAEIYWGPGTEMFYRKFQTEPLRGVPVS